MPKVKKNKKKIANRTSTKYVESKAGENELDFDRSAYVVHNKLETSFPCLSFDIIPDRLGKGAQRADTFPISFYMVSGDQTPQTIKNNYVYVMKVDNIKKLKQEDDDDDDDDDDEDDDDHGANQYEKDLPKLTSAKIMHDGGINRIRAKNIGERTLAATWSDKAKVHIFDLTLPLQAVNDYRCLQTYLTERRSPKPLYSFNGHREEGFAMDWSNVEMGTFATGDCRKDIHIWKLKGGLSWVVDQVPLAGHTKSVEDIKWSPFQPHELASCSVDKTIRLWDLRESKAKCCTSTISESHKADVNVIDWNKQNKNLIVSGGDDGSVKSWDLRYLSRSQGQPSPVAFFQYHKKAITSVEWHPDDDTVFATSSEDDKITIWDLAVEKDDEEMEVEETAYKDPSLEKKMKKKRDKKQVNDAGDDGKMEDDGEDSSSSSSSDSDYEDYDEEDEEEDGEKDKPEDEGVEYGDLNIKDVPPQMLFLHQGQKEIKELHWHPQLPGFVISTAIDGFNIFRTISA